MVLLDLVLGFLVHLPSVVKKDCGKMKKCTTFLEAETCCVPGWCSLKLLTNWLKETCLGSLDAKRSIQG